MLTDRHTEKAITEATLIPWIVTLSGPIMIIIIILNIIIFIMIIIVLMMIMVRLTLIMIIIILLLRVLTQPLQLKYPYKGQGANIWQKGANIKHYRKHLAS